MSALPEFTRPFDWEQIDAATLDIGGCILKGLLTKAELLALNQEVDDYLDNSPKYGQPETGSAQYNQFLGHNTIRLHGLVEKFPSAAELVGHKEITSWATRILAPKADSILLNAGELIQINPGEPRQATHRDTDSWPIALEADPIIVNAIVAFDDFTEENGATAIAPASWSWDTDRRPNSDEYVRAIMQRGDAVLFRGDLIHGGGANHSGSPRRAISLSYCAGWLRTVENNYLNVSRATLAMLTPHLQSLLGYDVHDGSSLNAGMVGLYENGDPRRFVDELL
ncbi:MAG: phytanoyl-CoA dioxygenase family protein [Pseudomonadota bacterium]